MKELYYTLNGKTPVPTEDVMEWGRWFHVADRHVARTQVGDFDVSTVFLGIDHNFGEGDPILFETMIFDVEDEWQRRYSTWEEAEIGHEEAIQIVKNGYPDLPKFRKLRE